MKRRHGWGPVRPPLRPPAPTPRPTPRPAQAPPPTPPSCPTHGTDAVHPHYGCLRCRAEQNERERQARIAERLPRARALVAEALERLLATPVPPDPGPEPAMGTWEPGPQRHYDREDDILTVHGRCSVHGDVISYEAEVCTECTDAWLAWRQAQDEYRQAVAKRRLAEAATEEIRERAATVLADEGYDDVAVAEEYLLAEARRARTGEEEEE